MLSDGRIDSLDTHLEQFKLNDQSRQDDLQNILKEYSQLLSDYKSLKKSFDQKSSRNVGATPPKGPANKPKNPYVLVLVDGNNYIFNDELIRDKEEGGMRAARMFHEAVEKQLHQNVPGSRHSRVIVRIYADLTNLSKQLAQSKVVGFDKRSIAPFSAGFTRAFSFSDFVDTLDEEGTKFKIREQFKAAAEDNACSHILFAACHDPAYLSQLVPYSGAQDKVTLVQGAGWNSDFHQFNLNVTQFPTIFRWSEISANMHSNETTSTSESKTTSARHKETQNKSSSIVARGPRQYDNWGNHTPSPLVDVNETSSTATSLYGDNGNNGEKGFSTRKQTPQGHNNVSQQPCKYFQKGFCRFGTKCSFQHITNEPDGFSRPPPKGPGEFSRPPPKGPSEFARPQLHTDIAKPNISANLPTSIIPGFIPINRYDQRLDTYIRPPTFEEWKIYNDRFRKQKPCNDFHLQRACTTFGCPFDHNELEPEARHVLEYVLKCSPCPRKSECREIDCYYGHICQKDGCTGQLKGCKMKKDMHNVDPVMVGTAPAQDELVHGGMEEQGPDEPKFLW